MKSDRVWYVVLNSHRARILHHLAREREPAAPETTLEAPDRHLRDIMADKPTRSFASAGGGRRSGVELASDPIRDAERQFLRRVFDHLETEHAAGAFDGLILVGSPEIVGLWRQEVPAALASLVRHEIVKNLVPVPPQDLPAALRTALDES